MDPSPPATPEPSRPLTAALVSLLRTWSDPRVWPEAFRRWAPPAPPPPPPPEGSPQSWGGRLPLLLVAAGVLTYAVVLSWLTIWRYETFQTLAWDLGTYNQSLYTTAHDHLLFYYTTELPSGVGGSLLATHLPLTLFLVLPAVYALPGPPTLLAVQASVVALGAFPAYALGRKLLGSTTLGVVVAYAYLLCPLTQGSGWYDFHPETFFPVAVLSAFYFLAERRPWPFYASWLLALASLEVIAPFLAIFAICSLIASHWSPRWARSRVVAADRRLLFVGTFLALGWMGLAYVVSAHFSVLGAGVASSDYELRWTVLGAPSVYEVLPYALFHPASALAALQVDAGMKEVYVLLLLGSLAFLPIGGEFRYLAPVLAWIGISVLASDPANYTIDIQYTSIVLPFLVAGAVSGLARGQRALRPWLDRTREAAPALPGGRWRHVRRVAPWVGPTALGASVVVAFLVASPLLPSPADAWSPVPTGVPAWTSHDGYLHDVVSLIPADGAVLTTGPIFPEVSDRSDAYVLPSVGTRFATDLTYAGLVDQMVNSSNYVLVDYEQDYTDAIMMQSYANLSGWGVAAAAEGVYLYERGYSGPPELWVPWQESMAGGELDPGNAVVDERNLTSLGPSLYHPPGLSGGNLLWTGPGLQGIGPGVYAVSFDISIAPGALPTEGQVQVAEVPITAHALNVPMLEGHRYLDDITVDANERLLLGATDLLGGAATAPAVSANVTLVMRWDGLGAFTTFGWATDPGMGLDLRSVTLAQVSAS
jgi:uncharacterized membrane protein